MFRFPEALFAALTLTTAGAAHAQERFPGIGRAARLEASDRPAVVAHRLAVGHFGHLGAPSAAALASQTSMSWVTSIWTY